MEMAPENPGGNQAEEQARQQEEMRKREAAQNFATLKDQLNLGRSGNPDLLFGSIIKLTELGRTRGPKAQQEFPKIGQILFVKESFQDRLDIYDTMEMSGELLRLLQVGETLGYTQIPSVKQHYEDLRVKHEDLIDQRRQEEEQRRQEEERRAREEAQRQAQEEADRIVREARERQERARRAREEAERQRQEQEEEARRQAGSPPPPGESASSSEVPWVPGRTDQSPEWKQVQQQILARWQTEAAPRLGRRLDEDSLDASISRAQLALGILRDFVSKEYKFQNPGDVPKVRAAVEALIPKIWKTAKSQIEYRTSRFERKMALDNESEDFPPANYLSFDLFLDADQRMRVHYGRRDLRDAEVAQMRKFYRAASVATHDDKGKNSNDDPAFTKGMHVFQQMLNMGFDPLNKPKQHQQEKK